MSLFEPGDQHSRHFTHSLRREFFRIPFHRLEIDAELLRLSPAQNTEMTADEGTLIHAERINRQPRIIFIT